MAVKGVGHALFNVSRINVLYNPSEWTTNGNRIQEGSMRTLLSKFFICLLWCQNRPHS